MDRQQFDQDIQELIDGTSEIDLEAFKETNPDAVETIYGRIAFLKMSKTEQNAVLARLQKDTRKVTSRSGKRNKPQNNFKPLRKLRKRYDRFGLGLHFNVSFEVYVVEIAIKKKNYSELGH